MSTVTYDGLTFEPYITNQNIQNRIGEIADEISREYKGRYPLLICVLNGAFPFAADLFRALSIDAEITFIRLKSYSGTDTTGAVKEVVGLYEDIAGRDVIVIEDIVDTGITIAKLMSDLREKHPASLKVASLLFKPGSVLTNVRPDYIGFEIPPKFIIGFGLDLDGKARNLRDIFVLKED